jgi:PST family polysaccharide transporter
MAKGFDDVPATEYMGRTTALSATHSLANQIVRFLVTIAGTAALARLLTPDAFGLFAMVLPVVGLAVLLRELGLPSATVQGVRIDAHQISNLFWISALASFAVGILTWVSAPFVAELYREPRVAGILRVVSIGLFLGGLGTQHSALLRRRMSFTALLLTETASYVLAMALAIVVAYATVSYWALVAQQVAFETLSLIGIIIATRWVPHLPKRLVGTKTLLAFGRDVTVSNAMNYVVRNCDRALIGAYLDSIALGFYSKAYQLLMWPTTFISNPVTRVMVPALSRLQGEPVRYRLWYRRGLTAVFLFTVPLFTVFVVLTPEVVAILLGDQWFEAVRIIRALAPAGFVSATAMATGWVYMSLGNTSRLARWSAFSALAVLGSVGVGLMSGIVGVAYCLSVVMVVLRIPAILICFRGTPLHWRDPVDSLLPSLGLSGIAGVCCYAVAAHLRSTLSHGEVLLWAGGTFCVAWMVAVTAVGGFRKRLMDARQLLQDAR